MSLNKDLPYGTILGNDPKIKYKYTQNGKFYNMAGRLVDENGKFIADPESKTAKKKTVVKKKAISTDKE